MHTKGIIALNRMESVSLYSEARNEYLKQLSTWIVPPLVEFFRKEYNSISAREGSKRAMGAFQEFCATVPRWNQDVIDTHIGVLLDTCRCDYVEELMTAVFIAHTKMLTAIRVSPRQKKLQITLPKLDHFLHRVFTECARSFWKAPFLFADDLTPIERQKNVLQAETMCTESLSGAVRSLLPVKSILRDYLNEDEDDEEEVPSKAAKEEGEEEEMKIEEAAEEAPVAPEVPEPVSAALEVSVPVAAAPEVSAPVAAVPEVHAPVATAPEVSAPVAAVPEVSAPVAAVPEVPVAVSIAEVPVPSVEKPVVETPSAVVANTASHKAEPVRIEKLDTPPQPIVYTPSSHSVENASVKPVLFNVEKDMSEPAQRVMIDTEPTVHFTPYDTVYDETTKGISEIRYTPKEDSGWNDDYVPKLTIGGESAAVGSDDIVDLEPVVARAPTPDVDMPLSASGDFEDLA